jgi:hypothetical protein
LFLFPLPLSSSWQLVYRAIHPWRNFFSLPKPVPWFVSDRRDGRGLLLNSVKSHPPIPIRGNHPFFPQI